jgi:hypothetical protein
MSVSLGGKCIVNAYFKSIFNLNYLLTNVCAEKEGWKVVYVVNIGPGEIIADTKNQEN